MNFPLYFKQSDGLTSWSTSEVANQSQTSGCLVTSGGSWPSSADEKWYSPKRPSSTEAVNSSELNTKESAFFNSSVYLLQSVIQLVNSAHVLRLNIHGMYVYVT